MIRKYLNLKKKIRTKKEVLKTGVNRTFYGHEIGEDLMRRAQKEENAYKKRKAWLRSIGTKEQEPMIKITIIKAILLGKISRYNTI